jgi:hypothetical protein
MDPESQDKKHGKALAIGAKKGAWLVIVLVWPENMAHEILQF